MGQENSSLGWAGILGSAGKIGCEKNVCASACVHMCKKRSTKLKDGMRNETPATPTAQSVTEHPQDL